MLSGFEHFTSETWLIMLFADDGGLVMAVSYFTADFALSRIHMNVILARFLRFGSVQMASLIQFLH